MRKRYKRFHKWMAVLLSVAVGMTTVPGTTVLAAAKEDTSREDVSIVQEVMDENTTGGNNCSIATQT